MRHIEREWVVALLNQMEKDFLTIRNVYRKRIKERGTPAKLPLKSSLPYSAFSPRFQVVGCDAWLAPPTWCWSAGSSAAAAGRKTKPALLLLTVQVRILSPRQPHRLPIFLLLLADTGLLFFYSLSFSLYSVEGEAVPKWLDDNSPRPLRGDSTRLYSTS